MRGRCESRRFCDQAMTIEHETDQEFISCPVHIWPGGSAIFITSSLLASPIKQTIRMGIQTMHSARTPMPLSNSLPSPRSLSSVRPSQKRSTTVYFQATSGKLSRRRAGRAPSTDAQRKHILRRNSKIWLSLAGRRVLGSRGGRMIIHLHLRRRCIAPTSMSAEIKHPFDSSAP